MLNEIITTTQFTTKGKKLITSDVFNNSSKFDLATISGRYSFRFFDSNKNDINKLNLLEFYEVYNNALKNLSIDTGSNKLLVLDNKSLIQTGKNIFEISHDSFKKVNLTQPLTRESLFIQTEFHDATFVFFFLWDKSIIDTNSKYKELIMLSGAIGYQFSLLAQEKNIEGTVFAGITPVEYNFYMPNDLKKMLPVFAFAAQ